MVDIADSNDLAKLAQKRQHARRGSATTDVPQAPVHPPVDPKADEEYLKALEESLIAEALLNKKRSEEVKARQEQIAREQEKEREEKKSRMQMAKLETRRPGQYSPPLRSPLGQRLGTPRPFPNPQSPSASSVPVVSDSYHDQTLLPNNPWNMDDTYKSQASQQPLENLSETTPTPFIPHQDKKNVPEDGAASVQHHSQVAKDLHGKNFPKLLEEQEFNIFHKPKTAEKISESRHSNTTLPAPEVIHASAHIMTRKDKVKFLIVRSIGNFLLLLSLYGVFATFGPAVYFEATYRLSRAKGIEYKVAANPISVRQPIGSEPQGQRLADQGNQPQQQSAGPSLGSILAGNKEQILVPPDTQFSIIIPKIGASSRVLPNVDPNNEEEFLSVLQQGVAHAKGTVFPGYPGSTYLFAHSTDNWWNVGRYNAVFYLLKDLQPGDEVIVFFEDKRYNYVITRSLITDPSDTQYLVDNRGDEQQLILQTCWPPGTTWKRILVFAKLKSEVTN